MTKRQQVQLEKNNQDGTPEHERGKATEEGQRKSPAAMKLVAILASFVLIASAIFVSIPFNFFPPPVLLLSLLLFFFQLLLTVFPPPFASHADALLTLPSVLRATLGLAVYHCPVSPLEYRTSRGPPL